MCELLGLSSNAPATVSVSLPKLAEHGRASGTYNDGWGVGYYEGADVRLMKDSAAVGDSEWIQFIAGHNLRSQLVIAHTRKATRGTRSYSNAQPFVRELAGRAHLFAHNGDLPGIFSGGLQADRFNPIGETDSELAFCVLLDRMAAIWRVPGATPTLRERFLVVSTFASQLRALGPANFLYCDGELLFAHGHRRKHAETGKVEAPGLVSLQRHCQSGRPGIVADGLSIRSDDRLVTLFASVPLTSERWEPLAEGELVAVSHGQFVGRQMVGESPVLCEDPVDPLDRSGPDDAGRAFVNSGAASAGQAPLDFVSDAKRPS
ncbi:class II glutamine amidotransferase [Bradyrhizobium sp.]|uniref:class II glutamine amidotransferase n=1 Tax=Bradyrhizobium sp. TaxID=376 RepID=UPI0027338189|nr:class II glutamine amidotransferase [Bradyrhizobium sp.]MDP3690730.1 class II glutamine amidotransferase [Bradyrhizobium sp.]